MSDDIFKILGSGHKKHGDHGKSHKEYRKEEHRDDDWDVGHSPSQGRHGKHGYGHGFDPATIVAALQKNKILLAAVVVAALLVVVFVGLVVMALLSISGPLVDFIAKSGLKGVVDAAQSIAQLIWQGSGK